MLSATTAGVALESAEEEALSSNFTSEATVRIRSCVFIAAENLTAVVLSALPVIRTVVPVANEAIIDAFAGQLLHANQQMAPTGPK